METLLTIIIMVLVIYFWGIKPNLGTLHLKKGDILEIYSKDGYILQDINYYYEIAKLIEKMDKDYFCVVILKSNKVPKKYKLHKNYIYDILVSSLQDKYLYCYFFKKNNIIVSVAKYGKANIEVFFNEKTEDLETIEFEDLKKYFGIVPRNHRIKN